MKSVIQAASFQRARLPVVAVAAFALGAFAAASAPHLSVGAASVASVPSPIVESRSAVGTRKFAGKRVHFIGIGGSGMSGLAAMLLDDGAIVSGSEPKPNGPVFELTKRGAKISRGQIGELLNKRARVVVEIGKIKQQSNAPIYAPDREKAVMEKVRKLNQGPLANRCLEAVYRELMSGSLLLLTFFRAPFQAAVTLPSSSSRGRRASDSGTVTRP